MPTSYLRPSAVGYSDQWTLGAGATKVAAVDALDPLSHDDSVTYIEEVTVNDNQAFTLTNKPPSAASFLALRVGVRSIRIAGTSCSAQPYIRLGGVNVVATTVSPGTAAWETAVSGSVARPGGGAWTMADVQSAGLEMGITLTANVGATLFVTSIWVEVDWALGGGLIFLL